MLKSVKKSINFGGKEISFEFGKYAPQADVSIMATMGETVVLVTVVVGAEKTDFDYFPLSVEYAEKLYAGGIIKGSRWVKREGRPSDDSVLTGRMIDRGIRSLFPKSLRHEMQIVATLLSVDEENDPSVLASITSACAVHLSSLPWKGPLSTCRIGYMKNESSGNFEYVLNPTTAQQVVSELDMVVSSTKDRVVMIETGAKILADDIVAGSIAVAVEANKTMIAFLRNFEANLELKSKN